MSLQFAAQVVLWQTPGLGAGDCPSGDGYSPHFVFHSDGRSLPVRFLDFRGSWNESTNVTVAIYHAPSRSAVAVSPGDTFDIKMGSKIVGRGTVLSELALA